MTYAWQSFKRIQRNQVPPPFVNTVVLSLAKRAERTAFRDDRVWDGSDSNQSRWDWAHDETSGWELGRDATYTLEIGKSDCENPAERFDVGVSRTNAMGFTFVAKAANTKL